MNKLIFVGLGFVLGTLSTTALFVALPQSAPAPLAVVAGDPSLTDAELAAEDDFLRIDFGKEDAAKPVVEPLKNSGNVRYITCEKPADLGVTIGKVGDDHFVARRNIDRYLRATNVLATKDCTCAGKVIPASAILAFEEKLKQLHGVEKLTHETDALLSESFGLIDQAEEMCGGRF